MIIIIYVIDNIPITIKTMLFGYFFYTVVIILTTILLIGTLYVFFKGTLTWWMRIINVVLIVIIGWLLHYEITSPHYDLCEKTVNGNVTEYTYYNFFKTNSVTETRLTDKYINGHIIEIRPSKYHVTIKIQLEDGNIIDVTTSEKVQTNGNVRVKKCYWTTTHYEVFGKSIY